MPSPRSEVWYLSANSEKGFTDDPEHALRDRFGHAVVSPQAVRQVWNGVYTKLHNQQNMIWETLLDKMEELYGFDCWENPRLLDPKDKRRYYELKGEIHALCIALTILRHAEKDGSVKDPNKAMAEVQAEADKRYEQSSS